MKKLIAIILLTLISAHSRAVTPLSDFRDIQADVEAPATFPFREVNRKFSVAFVGGYVGYSDPINYGAIGMALTAQGFYIDIMGFPAMHGSSTRVSKWNDKKSILVHVGYQLPVIKAFRIVPVLGYAYVSSGTTDGYKWSVNSSGIHNKYKTESSISRLDYGGVLVFNYQKAIFDIGITRSAVFGGIGIEF